MPIYQVQAPDGSMLKIEGPDGATDAQLIQAAQAAYQPTAQPTTQPAIKPNARELMRQSIAPAMNYSGGNVAGGFLAGAGSYLPKSMEQRYEGAAKDVLGADPESPQYQAAKIGGQAALTAGVGPALGAAAKALGAAPSLVQALTTSGMATGNSPVGFAAKAGDLALRTGAGAAVGGASAGVLNPKDAKTGAAIGALVPPALQTVGTIAKPIGRAFSNSVAERGAVDKIRETLTPEDIAALGKTGDIPLSASALTQNPSLAKLEQGSRLRNPEQWYDFGQTQGKAVSDKVIGATSEAELMAQRAATRQANWKANWADVEKSVNPQVFNAKIPEFQQNIDKALQSSESVNPAVRNMLEAIKADIARFGDNFSPAHLQQIRANLSGKYNPISPNAFASAPRDSQATRDVLKEVDNILNASTGGVWDKVPAAYKADSELLHQAKAASKVRSSFIDAETGRIRGVSLDPMGDVPKITEAGLGRSMDAARMPVTNKLALSPQAEQELSATLEALRKQNLVQWLKRAATAGGGSDTVSNAMALAPGGTTKNIIRQLIGAVSEAGSAKTNTKLAELLTNPQQLQFLLQNAPAQNNALAQLLYRSAPVIPVQ